MPLKKIKNNTPQTQTLEWRLHIKNYQLTLTKNTCTGCQICSLACPKEAITTQKTQKTPQQKTPRPTVDIDLEKCNFCGICDAICPYGAIKLTIDGQHALSVVEKESFPALTRNIQIDPQKFPSDPDAARDLCPLNLITMSYATPEGKPTQTATTPYERERGLPETSINIDKEHCPCCTICETKLPKGAIHVQRIITGKLTINQQKCPDGCTDCLDVCRITGTLYLSDRDKKVHANEAFCTYCGACKTVCPADGALELKRTHVNHSPIRSGAWNKALERLTSPVDLTKELKTRGSQKARESVKKRMTLGERKIA